MLFKLLWPVDKYMKLYCLGHYTRSCEENTGPVFLSSCLLTLFVCLFVGFPVWLRMVEANRKAGLVLIPTRRFQHNRLVGGGSARQRAHTYTHTPAHPRAHARTHTSPRTLKHIHTHAQTHSHARSNTFTRTHISSHAQSHTLLN